MQETQFQSLGQEDLLEKEMAAHSNILAWRISMGRGAWWGTVHGSQRMTKHSTLLHCRQIIYGLSYQGPC